MGAFPGAVESMTMIHAHLVVYETGSMMVHVSTFMQIDPKKPGRTYHGEASDYDDAVRDMIRNIRGIK